MLTTTLYPQVPESVRAYWKLLQLGYVGEGFSDTQEAWIYNPASLKRIAVSWEHYNELGKQPQVKRLETGIIVVLRSYKGDMRRQLRKRKREQSAHR